MQKKIFLITYHAKPNISFEDYEEVGGAYVNCWIEAEFSESADEIAQKEIEDYDWHIKTMDEIIEVSEEFYSNDDSKKEYFEQALIDKIVLVFHTYPKNQ